MYEIYLNSSNSELIVENLTSNETKPLSEMGIDFYLKADSAIKLQYPKAYEALVELHSNRKEMVYGRVRHFFACNFSVKDGRPDIDEDWNFDLEKVPCPARIAGICKHNICNPEISHELTTRETEVLRPFANARSVDEISEQLFISTATTHNHINNMYKKIGAAGTPNPERKLVAYAFRKGII